MKRIALLTALTGVLVAACDTQDGDNIHRSAPTDVCEDVPQCELECPPGTDNPVDDDGCLLTCQCEPVAETSPGDGGDDGGVGETSPHDDCADTETSPDSGIAETTPDDFDPCAGIPQCGFVCPPGTVNPIDEAGCERTCECVEE